MKVDLANLPSQLGRRHDCFRKLVDLMLYVHEPFIVETGTARRADNWGGDGMSTLIFDRLAEHTGGHLLSIDINPEASGFAVMHTGKNTIYHVGDSIAALAKVEEQIDLLYLDSLDLNWNDPHPAALHALMELTSAMPLLKPGSIVVVDDNDYDEADRTKGKGMYVRRYMQLLGKELIHDGYQLAWRM